VGTSQGVLEIEEECGEEEEGDSPTESLIAENGPIHYLTISSIEIPRLRGA
jgi:hypothetical protein